MGGALARVYRPKADAVSGKPRRENSAAPHEANHELGDNQQHDHDFE